MAIDYNQLKKGGFLKQRQKDLFILRLRTIAGNLTAEKMNFVAELAKKYGRGYVHVTTRQGLEIPWVKLEDYESLNREIKELGLLTGTCGPRIRTVVACPGNTVCSYGLMDAPKVAAQLDEAFFGREVPKKTKMAVSGCPNSCAKPQENDFGFVGAVEPALDQEKCTGCGLCVKVCPAGALVLAEGRPLLDRHKCIHEGNCIASCPMDAWTAERRGFHVYVGGKIGRFPRLGDRVADFVPEEDIILFSEKILRAFTNLGQRGERLADVLGRVGVARFRQELAQIEEV